MMGGARVRKGLIVRKGRTRGEGLYARVDGCSCFACVKWVEDREDATVFPELPEGSTGRAHRIASRDKGRIVRLRPRSSPQHGGAAEGQAQK